MTVQHCSIVNTLSLLIPNFLQNLLVWHHGSDVCKYFSFILLVPFKSWIHNTCQNKGDIGCIKVNKNVCPSGCQFASENQGEVLKTDLLTEKSTRSIKQLWSYGWGKGVGEIKCDCVYVKMSTQTVMLGGGGGGRVERWGWKVIHEYDWSWWQYCSANMYVVRTEIETNKGCA